MDNGLNNKTIRLFGILILVVIVILTSGCTSNSATNTYSGNGITFNYSPSWHIMFPNISGSRTAFSVVVFKDPMQEGTEVQINVMPSNESTQDVINNAKKFRFLNDTKLSNGTLEIDGVTAYQITYICNEYGDEEGIRSEQIGFVKNGNIYSIILQAPYYNFDKEKPNFDMVLNSFKVQESSSTFWPFNN